MNSQVRLSHYSLFTAALSAVVLSSTLIACGQSEWREVQGTPTAAQAPTGDVSTATNGQTTYVAPEVLVGQETPDGDGKQPVVLEQNQPLRVVDATPVGPNGMIAVRFDVPDDQPRRRAEPTVVKRSMAEPAVLEAAPKKVATKTEPPKKMIVGKSTAPKKFYVPVKHLNKRPIARTKTQTDADRYIMIQNIATEKLRVYERATAAGQPHKLVFEVDMIAGENNPAKTRRTAVGSYKIEKWAKFYQDGERLFPSWFDTELEPVPVPGSDIRDWVQPYLMSYKDARADGTSKGVMRGAFGWYTAKIGPNAHAQWTHGTIGWGIDKDKFIKLPKSTLAQFYNDPRSFGCTRVENRAIAYLHSLLPVGTRVIKVYARESIADKTLARYQDKSPAVFPYTLSKDEVRKENPNTIHAYAQSLRNLPSDSILEQGEYELDVTPSAVSFKKRLKTERNDLLIVRPEANLYDLSESSFQGLFLVDEGRFVNYQHPSELRKGGETPMTAIPSVVIKN